MKIHTSLVPEQKILGLRFQIGLDEFYEILNPPDCWLLADYIPRCTKCEKALHLVFNSPPRNGTACCKCGLNLEREFVLRLL